MKGDGLPHSETSGSMPVDGSPKLVAVFRVLHSLLMPRHPSCARIRLARLPLISIYVAILFNLQLPLFKDRRPHPSGANESILYQKLPQPRKGVNGEKSRIFHMCQKHPAISQKIDGYSSKNIAVPHARAVLWLFSQGRKRSLSA